MGMGNLGGDAFNLLLRLFRHQVAKNVEIYRLGEHLQTISRDSGTLTLMKAKFLNGTIGMILIAAVAILGIPQPASGRASQRFTGEQIFRGLFFGQAPVSQLFPELWASDAVKAQLATKQQVIAWDNLKENVTAWIQANDTTFMSRFGLEMHSGDHLRVQVALQEAGQRASAAMQNLGYLDREGKSMPDRTEHQVTATETTQVNVAAVTFVEAGAVAFVLVAVAIAIVFVTGPAGPNDDKTAFWVETLINNIVERLAVTQ